MAAGGVDEVECSGKKVTWSELWRMEPLRISFLLRSVYDVLPSPSNLLKWGLLETPDCQLCGARGTLAHILSGCKLALQQGRYRWRHDQVLRTLADILERERQKTKSSSRNKTKGIQFVKAGETARTSHESNSLLDGSKWQMRVDLMRRLVFPDVIQTTQRPDIVLWSVEDKKIIIIELTVPWEEGCDEAHERKSSKYLELKEECQVRGWKTWLFPVEVGCRGFPARSVWALLKAIGLRGNTRKRAVRSLGEEAEKASSWIWHLRDIREWKSHDTQ